MNTYTTGRRTNPEKLLDLLEDGHWHSTRELARRVSHSFAVAKFQLTRSGYVIKRERHPTAKYQHQYRLVDGPNS